MFISESPTPATDTPCAHVRIHVTRGHLLRETRQELLLISHLPHARGLRSSRNPHDNPVRQVRLFPSYSQGNGGKVRSQSRDSNPTGPLPRPRTLPSPPPSQSHSSLLRRHLFLSPSYHFLPPSLPLDYIRLSLNQKLKLLGDRVLFCAIFIHTESHALWVLSAGVFTHPLNCETAAASGTKRLLHPKGALQTVWNNESWFTFFWWTDTGARANWSVWAL